MYKEIAEYLAKQGYLEKAEEIMTYMEDPESRDYLLADLISYYLDHNRPVDAVSLINLIHNGDNKQFYSFLCAKKFSQEGHFDKASAWIDTLDHGKHKHLAELHLINGRSILGKGSQEFLGLKQQVKEITDKLLQLGGINSVELLGDALQSLWELGEIDLVCYPDWN
jgi:hypothetical protein